jgi:rhomboid protease GluP
MTEDAAPKGEAAPNGEAAPDGEGTPKGETEPPRSAIADSAEVARGFTGAPVAGALVAANIGIFAAQLVLAGHMKYALGMPDGVLRWLGANASLWTISDNRFETLLTSAFLHASVLHLFLNMLVLWQVGPLLERAIGSARFLPLYLAAAVVGSASSAIWGRFFGQTVSVGASGALCGLIAAATIVGVRTEGWRGELTIGMGRWLGLIFLIGLIRAISPTLSQIDNAAHVGGALAGAIVAATWERGFIYARRSQRVVLAASIALVVAAAAVVYVRNHTDPLLFMNVEERKNAAYDALREGQCESARNAIQRAMQMDPKNGFLRADAHEIERECSPSKSRDAPRVPR